MSTKWKKLLTREGVDLVTISAVDLAFIDWIKRLTRSNKELFFTYFKDKKITHYTGIDSHKLGNYLFKRFYNSEEKIKRYYKEGKIFIKNVSKNTKQWTRNLNPKSQNKLFLEAFKNFKEDLIKSAYDYVAVSWLAIEAWQREIEILIPQMIKRNNLEKEKNKIFASVYKPWKETAIIELQRKIAKGVIIDRLIKNYQFLRSWVAVWYRPIDESWIKALRKGLKKETKLKFYSLKKIIKILKPNKKEKEYLKLAPYLIFFKDYRDDLRRKIVYLWSFLFDLIAKKFKIERNNLGYLSLEEIEKSLKKGSFPEKVINWRKNYPCIITSCKDNLKIKIIDRNIPIRYQKIITQIEKEEKGKKVELHGIIAQNGEAVGRVRIMNTYHDIKKIQKGDIFVTNTAHPNYLPGMQKSAAIITNEGGITCHAAIVSRELKIPCIVGTKIATKVLKDGDLVEVDANKGIVKILKKK